MTELNEFIHSQGKAGLQKSEGSFTVKPELARRKLADSVPENFANGWSALCFLRGALQLAALRPAANTTIGLGIVPFHSLFTMGRNAEVRMGLRYISNSESNWQAVAKDFRDILVKSCEQPFADSSPVGLCLSRAVLILSKLKLSASFHFLDTDLADYTLLNDPDFSFDDKHIQEAKGKESTGLVVCIQDCPDWCEVLSKHKDDRPLYRVQRLLDKDSPLRISRKLEERSRAKEFSLFGLKLQRDSVWTQSPVQELLELGFCPYSGSWFDYRCKQAILAEVFISSSSPTPLTLSKSCAPPPTDDGILRPGQLMTNWDRFRSQAERLILRWWDTPPAQEDEPLYARAVFAVGLSEASSKVAFLNWGGTKEMVSLPKCPPGLGGVVYWPSLKQSLYGESWVRDESYQEALNWTMERAQEIFSRLEDEFEYVWEMLVRDHVRKSYRPEVRRCLQAWLKSE